MSHCIFTNTLKLILNRYEQLAIYLIPSLLTYNREEKKKRGETKKILLSLSLSISFPTFPLGPQNRTADEVSMLSMGHTVPIISLVPYIEKDFIEEFASS